MPNKLKPAVKVIFRKWRSDDTVFALFPELAGSTADAWLCVCYGHPGGHAAAAPHYVVSASKPCGPKDFKELKAELHSKGYKRLRVVKRFTRGDWETRKQQAKP
jgi:hypothetical protein